MIKYLMKEQELRLLTREESPLVGEKALGPAVLGG